MKKYYNYTVENWIEFMKEQGLSNDEIAKKMLVVEQGDDLVFFEWCLQKRLDLNLVEEEAG